MLNFSFQNSISIKRKIVRIFILAFFLTSCVTIQDKKDVGKIMDEFHYAYDPIFKSLGVNFKIKYLTTGRENVTVKKDGSNWTITIFDGFINHPQINRNGLRIALCHEIGHLLGPKGKGELYASEYASDAYAILACGIVLKMDTDQLLDGIESIFQWYRLYPVEKKYPHAGERRDIMIRTLIRINPSG